MAWKLGEGVGAAGNGGRLRLCCCARWEARNEKKRAASASTGVGWLQDTATTPECALRVASAVSRPSTRGAHASGVFWKWWYCSFDSVDLNRLTASIRRWFASNPWRVSGGIEHQSCRPIFPLQILFNDQHLKCHGSEVTWSQCELDPSEMQLRLSVFFSVEISMYFWLVGHVWACSRHFHEMIILRLLFLNKLATTLVKSAQPYKVSKLDFWISQTVAL